MRYGHSIFASKCEDLNLHSLDILSQARQVQNHGHEHSLREPGRVVVTVHDH